MCSSFGQRSRVGLNGQIEVRTKLAPVSHHFKLNPYTSNASLKTLRGTSLSSSAAAGISSWSDLHRWSVTEIGPFWQTVSDFCGIRWIKRGHGEAYTPPTREKLEEAIVGGEQGKPPKDVEMTQGRWFEGAKLNFAHNLLPPPTENEVIYRHVFLFSDT